VDQPPFPSISESEPRLTPRQREVLDLIASGLSTSEIAKKLTLSTETVRNHVRSVLRELHVHTRLEAIAAARRRGLLAQPALKPLPAAGATARLTSASG
jgi:DNA-binding NarL/FixJ family response regulator